MTPFKPGMRPGDPGRSKQSQSSVATTSPLALKTAAKKETLQKAFTKDKPACVLQRKGFFSLCWCTNLFSLMSLIFFWIDKAARIDRQTLALSGLQPQQYGADDLESMGMQVIPHLQSKISL